MLPLPKLKKLYQRQPHRKMRRKVEIDLRPCTRRPWQHGRRFLLNNPAGAASNLRLTCLKFSVAGDGNAAEDFS
jgi:hypothetical protein